MAAPNAFPESFRDPQYAALDQATEQSLGLPDGLLSSIRLNGERSNASAVSSAGARTPYQITPATRQLALDKWGVDPYLSPQNASDVAGRLLAESLQRNQGNTGAAVGEYIGGTDRSNWGKQTSAYVQRVLGALPNAGQPQGGFAPNVQGMSGPSTFDRAQATMQQQQAPSQLNAIYQAYASGQMSPQERAEYEADVQSGKMMLPPGASLQQQAQPGAGGATQGTAPPPIPAGVVQAWQSGQMSAQDAKEFEQDVRAGAFSLPQGVTPDQIFGAQQKGGILDRLSEAVTGSKRATPQTQSLPDWSSMPEMNIGAGGDTSVGTKLKIGLGTLSASPAEIAKVMQANVPGVKVSQDAKGNYLLTSPTDGKQYAIKPGLTLNDVIRGAAGAGEFALANEVMPGGGTSLLGRMGAGAATGAAGATALEAQKAAAGGGFDPSNVALSAGLGAAAPAAAAIARPVLQPAQRLIQNLRGVNPGEAPITPMEAPTAAPATAAPAAPAIAAAPAATVQDVAGAARNAASGSKQAAKELADLAAPDAQVTDAAKRLGIEDYLQPDHVTSSDAYRQVLGVLKSNPTSQLALTEKEGLAQIGQRASSLIDEIGGSNDLSTVNAGLKAKMAATHADALNAEDALWTKLRNTIPAKQPAPASATLDFLQQRLDDLGGDVKSLTPMERDILARATPKTTTIPGRPIDSGAPELGDVVTPSQLKAWADKVSESGLMRGQGLKPQAPQAPAAQVIESHPTYARLDDIRKDVGMAARQQGPFSDADTGLAKKYYSLLTKDQEAAAGPGNADLVQQAKAATVVRKGLEDDMTSLFGKNLDRSMAPDLASGMRAAGNGDPSALVRMLQATPEDMRPQVVASGLGTVFRNAATRGDISFGQFSKWWGNLQRNQTAFNAVMTNLSPEARQQIADLATVSKAIDASQQARIRTGLRSSVLDEMNAPDNLASRMFDLAKHAGKGLAVDAVGGHGAGLAMGLFSALKGSNKPSALKALDEVLTSPEFVQMARAAGTPGQQEAARKLAFSQAFTRFARAVGNSSELSDRQRFILNALQGANAANGGGNVPARH